MKMSLMPRAGSVLVLLLAIIIMIAVMAFGLLDYSNSQRQGARNSHQASLLRMALSSGRAHALKEIENAYVTAGDNGHTDLRQSFITTFSSATDALGRVWQKATDPGFRDQDGPASDPGKPRRDARMALVNDTAQDRWGDLNTQGMWQIQRGLSSAYDDPINAYDLGYTMSDGTAQWFDAGWYDRSLMKIEGSSNQAAYRLRYAVSVIDLSGQLLGNKARYEHLLHKSLGVPMHPRDAYGSATAALEFKNSVMTEGEPCAVTDPPLGPKVGLNSVNPSYNGDTRTNSHTNTQDGFVFDESRLNTWRPIPTDHSHIAYFLATIGFGIEDSLVKQYEDRADPVNGPGNEANSQGQFTTNGGKPQIGVYYKRTPITMPTHLRAQGYRTYTQNHPQWSTRFIDWLPFEMNAWAPMVNGSPKSRDDTNRGTGDGVVFMRAPASADYRKYPIDYGVGGYSDISAVGSKRAVAGDFSTSGIEVIRNRHPANLVCLKMQSMPGSAMMMWQSLDFFNWAGIAQSLRIHQAQGNNGKPVSVQLQPQSLADCMVQCFTPFGSSIGFFDTARDRSTMDQSSVPSPFASSKRTSPTPTDKPNLVKNQWEMRTQWALNINTVAPKTLEGVLRMVIADDGANNTADKVVVAPAVNPYDTYVATLAVKMASKRPIIPADLTWDKFDKPPSVFSISGRDKIRAQRGMSSLIHGGPTGSGPVCEFEVNSLLTSATPGIVIKGAHANRFHNSNEAPFDSYAPNTEYRVWLATGPSVWDATIVPDLRMLSMVSGTSSASGQDIKGGSITSGGRRMYAPFRIKCQNPSGSGNVVATATDTTLVFDTKAGLGYADEDDWKEIKTRWIAGDMVAYIDYCNDRRREFPDVPWPEKEEKWKAWYDNGPGLSLVSGRSRHYRFVVKAQLYDIDRPQNTKEQSWDFVYLIDPDRSGPTSGNGFSDAACLYSDRK